jgi:hypothetical protein
MSKTFAVISRGIVDNLIAADTEEIALAVTPDWQTVIEVEETLGICVGWNYDGTNFINPNPPVVEEPVSE